LIKTAAHRRELRQLIMEGNGRWRRSSARRVVGTKVSVPDAMPSTVSTPTANLTCREISQLQRRRRRPHGPHGFVLTHRGCLDVHIRPWGNEAVQLTVAVVLTAHHNSTPPRSSSARTSSDGKTPSRDPGVRIRSSVDHLRRRAVACSRQWVLFPIARQKKATLSLKER
jgi:hypothetical protein